VPDIFTGIRLGLIYALVNIIGIEFLINFGGLGRVVSDLYDRFEIPGMYAAIGFIILVSASVFAVLARIEKRIRPV
jgi:ABC-type nitrate/sulfonate/bicarbonate transport system permease component